MEENEEYIKNRALPQTQSHYLDNNDDNDDNLLKIKIKTMDNSIF